MSNNFTPSLQNPFLQEKCEIQMRICVVISMCMAMDENLQKNAQIYERKDEPIRPAEVKKQRVAQQ